MTLVTPNPRDAIAEHLEELSLNALKTIAKTLGVAPRSADRPSYIVALADFIGSAKHLDILRAHLSDQEWAILNLLPLRVGLSRLRSLYVLVRRLGVDPGQELALFSKLLAYSCLLPGNLPVDGPKASIDETSLRSYVTTRWFSVPDAVRQLVRDRFPDAYYLTPGDPPSSVAPPVSDELRRAAYILLAEVASKPVKLTMLGVPYKNEVARLVVALSNASAPTGKVSRAKAVAAPSTPPLLWFALSTLLCTQVLVVVNNQIDPGPAAPEFQSSTGERQLALLARGWLDGIYDDLARLPAIWSGNADSNAIPWVAEDPYSYEGRPDSRRLSNARNYTGLVLTNAVRNQPDGWYDVGQFATLVFDSNPELLFNRLTDYELLNPQLVARQLRRTLHDAYPGIIRVYDPSKGREDLTLYLDRDWALVEGAFIRQCIAEPLRWLGFVECGPDLTAPKQFRLTALARHYLLGEALPASPTAETADAVVQPNFDVVVVDALAKTGALAQLDAFAERRSLDRAATYHLSQAALLRALDRGWTGSQVLDTLAKLNRGPLPQNVRFTLEEWVRLYERVTLRGGVTLLEAGSPTQVDGWLANRDLASLLGKRLGPTAILVPRANVEAVIKLAFKRNTYEVVDYSRPRSGLVEVRGPDLIVAPAPDPYLDYQLRSFSTPIAEKGSTVTFQITTESVKSARVAGHTGQSLVDFLDRTALNPVPADIRVRILGWSGAVGAMTDQSVIALSLPSTVVTWPLLALIPAISALLQNILSDRIALVVPENLEPIRAELAKRGISLRRGMLAPDPPRRLDPPVDSALSELAIAEKAFVDIFQEEITQLGDVVLPWPMYRMKKS